MGFFKSLKGNHPATIGSSDDGYAPPSNPPSSHYQMSTTPSRLADSDQYAPPKGPPPGRDEYAPPPGPPPSFSQPSDDPPPYHDWTVIPDNSLLPPPPSLGHDTSPSGNASSYDADRARDYCQRNSLMTPYEPTQPQYESVRNGDVRLVKPCEYNGDLLMVGTGAWRGSTRSESSDSCLLTSFPLYFACADSPFRLGTSKTIYFEIRIRSFSSGRRKDDSSIALGYTGVPYPTWRMPGWQRGSLAVHGDDGRKYINDSWGGKAFTSSFKEGETIGLGMVFSPPEPALDKGASRASGGVLKAEVFLTRDGQRVDGWDLHEQLDAATDFGIDGLDGQYDLFGAVGTFGGVKFDVLFNSKDWLWQPR